LKTYRDITTHTIVCEYYRDIDIMYYRRQTFVPSLVGQYRLYYWQCPRYCQSKFKCSLQ